MLAGFGSAVITPELPVMLAGFGDRHEPATEVHDDLEVRVLYLAGGPGAGAGNGGPGGGNAVCLIVCDLLGMSHGYSWPVRKRVAEELGLPLGAVLTASTHTHSGPSCIAGSEAIGWPTPPGYGGLLAERAAAAARSAKQSAVPALLAYRRAALPAGLSINRRQLPYEPWLAMLDICAVADSAGSESGETHHTSGTSERLGTLANLAIHPVALGPECHAVSADWVAPFRSALEASLGGTAIMLSGALGDVNPRHVHRQENTCQSDGFAEAAELGGELAEVVSGEVTAATPLGEAIEILRAESVELAVGETILTQIAPQTRQMAELIEWSLGGARLVSIPGEGFHAFGNAVAAARTGPVLLAGLAPVWLGYLPVPFGEGYEESMSLGEPFVTALLAHLTAPPR